MWFTDTRQAHDSAGNACEERVLEIRRDGRRIPVPLLYTGSLPRLINDSTIEAPIWLHCRPGNLYRVNLHTGVSHEGAVRKTLLLMVLIASRAEAQGPGFELGRLFTEPAATTYRIGFTAPISGPLSGGIHGTYMDAEGAIGNLWGAGADLALFKGGKAGLYLIGGMSGGMVTQGSETFWGSWSGGLGYELFPFRALSLGRRGPVSCPRPRRLSRRGAGLPPRRAETVAPARAGNQDRNGTGAVLTSYHRSHARDTRGRRRLQG